MTTGSQISELLRDLSSNRAGALERLIPLVYPELRRIAHTHLRRERPGHTLTTTAIVHEAYLKLLQLEQVEWKDRAHFLATCARIMRRILIDYARGRKRDKRGGGTIRVSLSEARDLAAAEPDELLALEAALTRLEAINARLCRVVECRCFSGLSVEETAAALDTSPATVKRDWAFSRAWLNRELAGGPPGGANGLRH